MEVTQEVLSYYGEADDILTKAINEEIIHEISKATLLEQDYTYVYVRHDVPADWFVENTFGEYKAFGWHYYFKRKSDAATFILHWKE